MSSSEKDLITGLLKYLEDICKYRYPTEETKNKIMFLQRDLKFIDGLLSLRGSFTNECTPPDVMQKIDRLFQYTVVRFKDTEVMGYLIDRTTSMVIEKIRITKLEIRAELSIPKTSLPLPRHNIVAATPKCVKKFLDTAVRNLSDLLMICAPHPLPFASDTRRDMEEFLKELKLLRAFFYFILDRFTDPQIQHTFFTNILDVGSRAVMDVWLNLPDYDNGNQRLASIEMNVSFSDLQIMVQPSQPYIRKIYTDVLQALKPGWHLDLPIEYVADCEASFAETLIHHLEGTPITGEDKVIVALKDQKEFLHEMLVLLRANLMDLRKEDLRFHIQEFDAAIIDLGLLVYSLYERMQKMKDMDGGDLNQASVLHLSSRIHSMQKMIYLIHRKSFQSMLPKIDGLGSIDIILYNMKELLSLYPDSLADHIKNQVQTIQEEFEHFQKQLIGEYHYYAMQVIVKVHEVEHIVISCINKGIHERFLARWIEDIVGEIILLMREVAEIHEKKVPKLVFHNTNDVASAHSSQFASITSMKEELVGFEDVIDNLRQKLMRESSKLDVISIVGMPGSGKTTLATKLYLDQSVVSRFDVCANCCVSQVYTRKELLLAILHGVNKDMTVSDKVPENELADKLRRLLLVKRYLILVDDVWETSAWDDLKPCFRDANNGSRIILTTRHADVAFYAKLDSDPYSLRSLTHKESWMLLKNKVFNEKNCPPILNDIGRKIVQKCGGLPLSVVLVAGILETMEKEKRCWEQVAQDLGAHIQDKSEVVIELSYQHLPYHLKPCFLYFGGFMEDEAIQVSKLTWLWMAEGLVSNHPEKLSEDTAEYYLKNLIGRNLVMVAKKSSDGKIKACRIHDLLLDFCRKKSKDENFLEWIKGYKGMDPSSFFLHQSQRRLSLCSQGDNLAKCSLICSPVTSFRFRESRNIVLSSVDRASFIFNNFKFLRVLDLELTLIDSFPEALTFLRYVAMRITEDSSLSFLGNFGNVETLIVKGIGGRVSLPHTLWNMVKLRHLHIYKYAIFVSESTNEMVNLQTLSSVQFSSVDDADNILAKTPNLWKLRCEVSKLNGAFPAFDKLEKLEMLKFSFGRAWIRDTQLNFPQNLKKLTLSDGRIQSLDQVAALPRLEVLKLLGVTTNPEVWEVSDEQFPQLRFLKLQNPSFSEWNVSDDAFPLLEHLVLKRCRHLEEIPSRFEDASSLKSVEIISCNEALAESAMAVRETCTEISGTSGFDIFIHK